MRQNHLALCRFVNEMSNPQRGIGLCKLWGWWWTLSIHSKFWSSFWIWSRRGLWQKHAFCSKCCY